MTDATATQPLTTPASRQPDAGRPGALTALILAVFAAGWFSWGQGSAPGSWASVMETGGIASVAVAAVAAGRLLVTRRGGPATPNPAGSRRYGYVVVATYAVIGLGIAALAIADHPDYIAPWVGAVVGAHFWALSPVLRDRLLPPLGLVVVLVAGTAIAISSVTSLHPAALTGAGIGTALVLAALTELLCGRGLRTRVSVGPATTGITDADTDANAGS